MNARTFTPATPEAFTHIEEYGRYSIYRHNGSGQVCGFSASAIMANGESVGEIRGMLDESEANRAKIEARYPALAS